MLPNLEIEASKHKRGIPSFGPIRIIGYIGLENLKFARNLREGRVKLDLNLLKEEGIVKEEGLDVKLTELLLFLKEHEKRLNLPRENMLHKALFFCYRGLLKMIASTPYEEREPWIVVAILHKGIIFLCKRYTEKKLQDIKNMTEEHKMYSMWGFKFEQFILSDKPDEDPNLNEPLNANKEFSLIFSSKINNHKIIYGAETDGIKCDKNTLPPPAVDDPKAVIKYLSSKEFVELKTSEHCDSNRKQYTFRRYKTLTWWCQSYLAGIDTVVCGLRNKAGIVEDVQLYRLDELVDMAQGWNPKVCLNFMDDFLTHVKRCFDREIRRKYGDTAVNKLQTLPLMSIKFEYNLGSMVQVNDNYNHEDDPILHDWFLKNYGKHRT